MHAKGRNDAEKLKVRKMLSEGVERCLSEAEVLATNRHRSVEGLAKILVRFIFREIKLCHQR
jgi:hypothetical protein